jgi:general secretion pathway protein G
VILKESRKHKEVITMRKEINRGFTLIEVMIVVMILGLLASLVVVNYVKKLKEAKIQTARFQVTTTLKTALDMYNVDNGNFPTTSQGLKALAEKPSDEPVPRNWSEPYLESGVPDDPWGNPYVYVCPGQHRTYSFDLSSMGPDGRAGTEDDINNWDSNK